METLRIGKFRNQIATAAEVNALRDEMIGLMDKYNWHTKTLMPWSNSIPLVEILNSIPRDYDNCTYSSKVEVCALLNGLIPILEAWEYNEIHGVLIMNIESKRIRKVPQDLAEGLIEIGGWKLV